MAPTVEHFSLCLVKKCLKNPPKNKHRPIDIGNRLSGTRAQLHLNGAELQYQIKLMDYRVFFF